MFLNVTHHEILDCIAAAAFQKLHLGDACGTDCGAAASFKNNHSTFYFGLLLTFALCFVGSFFVAQSHSVDSSRWSDLLVSSHSYSRITFLSFF